MTRSGELATEDQGVLASESSPLRSRSFALGWFACALLFGALCVAEALVWEPAHDEGVTWTQAFGELELARCDATTPLRSLESALDGGNRHAARDVVAALVRDGMHPPAYYLLVNRWASWVGTGRVALCLPAIGLGVLSLLAMGWLARALAPGTHSSVWAMLLLACSPWFVGYSVLARPYGLVLFAALWSSVALLEMQAAPRSGSRRRWLWRAIFVACSCLGLYALYHYAFVVAWQGLALLWLALGSGERRASELTALFAMAAATALAYTPWFASLLAHLAVAGSESYYFDGWFPLADWPTKFGHLLLVFGLGEGQYSIYAAALRTAATALGIATLPLALWALAPSRLKELSPAARALWLAAPALPLLILTSDWLRDTHTLFISKTTFIFLPLLILWLLRAWQGLERRPLTTLGLSACALLCVASTASAIHTRGSFLTSFEVVAEYLRRTDTESHRVVLSSDRRGYTIPFLLTLRDAQVQNLSVTLAPSERLESCVDSLLADSSLQRLTLVDFQVPYEREGKWGEPALERVAQTARSQGWQERRLSAGDPKLGVRARNDRFWRGRFTELAGDPRVLVIANSTKTKYFSE